VEFGKYRASPEFVHQNSDMDLAGFKSIFWWEWGHRLLGRFVGLVWAVGFFFFLATKRIPAGWTPRLAGLGVLGGAQGAIGWWMVSSGLTGRMVDVAGYRLAIHLGLAFVILGLTTWYILQMSRSEAVLMQARRGKDRALGAAGGGLMYLAFVQILLGALVAGIDAGTNYVDWPLMAGQFVPDTVFELTPVWSNFFENIALVQFNHRMVGYLVFLLALWLWVRARRNGNRATKRAVHLMAGMVVVQVVLGIVTVMQAAQMHVALTHQVGAIVLWVLILRVRFMAGYPVEQSIRG
jgi:cytochrome c oxidase assembly protein subunit 15